MSNEIEISIPLSINIVCDYLTETGRDHIVVINFFFFYNFKKRHNSS